LVLQQSDSSDRALIGLAVRALPSQLIGHGDFVAVDHTGQ
jgi:hypothetical protein